MYVHVVAPTLWDKMEHLRELQWVRAVVDLDRRAGDECQCKIMVLALGAYHEQASHVHDERCNGRGRRLCIARGHFVLHFLEG